MEGFERIQAGDIGPGDRVLDVYGGSRLVGSVTPRAHGRVAVYFADHCYPAVETFNAAQELSRQVTA